MKDIQEVKEKIINLLSDIERKGMDKVIKYLEESDFFVHQQVQNIMETIQAD